MKEDQTDRRRVFLDVEGLTQWDHHITQRFPQAEKVVEKVGKRGENYCRLTPEV